MKNISFSLFFLYHLISSSFNLDPNKKRVILIGIDGLMKRCMNQADTSVFRYMMREGSWTLNGRTVIEALSGPGWSNILCGLETEDTGIFDNEWRAPWMFGKRAKINPITADKAFPCVFSELKKNNKDLNIKVTWSWTWFLNMGSIAIPGSIDKEDFCDPYPELELDSWIKCDQEMYLNALKNIDADFDFLFVYFGSVDSAGHLKKFCSDEYVDRISAINNHIEGIFDHMKKAGIYNNTYVILTTDHGGEYMKNWHGMQNDDNLQVPFYIIGPGIKKGYRLTNVVKTEDVTPTILHLFGYSLNRLWRSKVVVEAFIEGEEKFLQLLE